ncbi:MAG: sulfotransferase family protein [Caulobacteraceae bacterium]
MVQQLHAISGLPRSGSTLLSAILRQNPRFKAEVTSPLLMLCGAVQEKMTPQTEFHAFFDDERRRALLRGLFESYYRTANPKDTVFDTNRAWTAKSALLKDLYPKARIICCVREVGWIIDSLEQLLRKTPLQLSRVFAFKPGSSVYGRVETLMNSESGLIGLAWSGLREAWFGEDADRLIVIRYETLVRDPGGVMDRLYRELGEPHFAHDFNNLNYEATSYDADLGMPGLHTVKRTISADTRKPIIPPDIFAAHADLAFWNRPEMNQRGAIVL